MVKYKCHVCGEEQRLWLKFSYMQTAECQNEDCHSSAEEQLHLRALDWKIAAMISDDYK